MIEVHTNRILPKTGTVLSQAGTNKDYIVAQMRTRGGTVHVQIIAPDAETRNRVYGFSLDLDDPDLRQQVRSAEISAGIAAQD